MRLLTTIRTHQQFLPKSSFLHKKTYTKWFYVLSMFEVCTDAARSLGFVAIFENEWFYGSWNELVKDYPITY
jgi:hypothetical protein